MKERTFGRLLCLVLPFLKLQACQQIAAPESKPEGFFSEGRAYLWDRREIDVCWQDFGDKYINERESVKSVVTSEYARAGFTFKGWNDCKPGDKGIWIQEMSQAEFDRSGNDGVVKEWGKRIDGEPGGVRLFFNYKILANVPENVETSFLRGYSTNENKVSQIALHEIGHALGLRHESDRQDASCFRERLSGMSDEPAGAIPVGAYDKDSIMNYCTLYQLYWSGNLARLSPGDIATLKFVYDAKTTFPREKACQGDGNKWGSGSNQSCCVKQAGGKEPPLGSRIYRFCEELKPFSADPIVIKKSITTHLGALPFAKPGIGVLSCDELDVDVNYVPSKAKLKDGASHVIDFDLFHPTRNQLGSYHCNSLTMYDNRSIFAATEAVRYTFSPAASFPIDRDPQSWDLTKHSYQRLKVSGGIIAGESMRPFKTPEFVVSLKQGTLVFSLPVLNVNTKVQKGSLDCGQYRLAVLGQNMNPGEESNILELVVQFDKDVLGTAVSLECKGLDLSLKVPDEKNREASASFAFSQPLKFQLDGRSFRVSLPGKTCFKEFD